MQGSNEIKLIQAKATFDRLIGEYIMVVVKDEDKPQDTTMRLFRIINKPSMVIMPDDDVEGYLVKTTYTSNKYKDSRYAFYITDNLSSRLNKKNLYSIVDIAVIDTINSEGEFMGNRVSNIPTDTLYKTGRKSAPAMMRYLCVYMILQYVKNPNEAEICGRYNKKRMFNYAINAVEQSCETYPKFKLLRDKIKNELDIIYNNIKEQEREEFILFTFLDNF
jgi:hypothetical protein